MALRFGMSDGRPAAAAKGKRPRRCLPEKVRVSKGMTVSEVLRAGRTAFVPRWLTGRWRFGFGGGLEHYSRQIQDDATLLDIVKQVVSSQEFEIVCAKCELR